MSPQVKRAAVDYFEKRGGIESVPVDRRYALKRTVVSFLIDLEERMSWDNLKVTYMSSGNDKPFTLNYESKSQENSR